MNGPTPTTAAHRAVRLAAAAAVWCGAWAFAIAALVLRAAFDLPPDPLAGVFLSGAPRAVRTIADDIDVTVALVQAPVAALILARRPHPVAVVLGVSAIGSGIAAFGISYGLLGAIVPGLPWYGFVAHLAGWAFVPGTFFTAALPLLLTSHRVPRWQRGVFGIALALGAAATFVSATNQAPDGPRNPLAIDIPAYQAVLEPVYTALSLAALGISLLTCAVVATRWARARGRARAGLAWLTAGQIVLTVAYLAQALPPDAGAPAWTVDLALLTPVAGQVVYAAALLVVVLRQRLWGVEPVVSRLVLWALLSVAGVALWIVVVTLVPASLMGSTPLAFAAPVVIAVAIVPFTRWLQRRIDRLIYGEGADAAHLLAQLAERIGELPPGPEGLSHLAGILRRVLRLSAVEIRTPRTTAVVGSPRGSDPIVLVLTAGDLPVGELRASAPGGQSLDRRTRTVLADVAGLVAAVVQLGEAYLALESERAALAARRAEERRAIRRDLHDGLGPALAGIGFSLAAVENMRDEPDRAHDFLDTIAADVRAYAREVHELAPSGMPLTSPADDLAAGLHRLARLFDGPRLRVRAHTSGTAPIPADVGETLLFLAGEAVSNAARHARAHGVTVRVHASDDETALEVADDGIGVPAGAAPGVGTASMRERAAAHGGVLHIRSGPRGTTVTARVPHAPRSSARAGTPGPASQDAGTDTVAGTDSEARAPVQRRARQDAARKDT